MYLFPIRVETYAGYRTNEYPKCFYFKEKRIDIRSVSDRWYQAETRPEMPAADYYKVHTDDDQFIIKHETGEDAWYLALSDINKVFKF